MPLHRRRQVPPARRGGEEGGQFVDQQRPAVLGAEGLVLPKALGPSQGPLLGEARPSRSLLPLHGCQAKWCRIICIGDQCWRA